MALILVAFELVLHFALKNFSESVTYSPLVPMVLLVMMRWGWPAVFYAVGDGLLYCLLKGLGWQSYLSYCIGNSFIMLLLLITKFVGKEKITRTWYFTALFAVLGWALVYFGRAIVAACCGLSFAGALVGQMWEILSLIVAVLLVVIFRKLDGMFEDQKHYLKRLNDEREEMRRRDTFGDEQIDIDEDTMSILKRWDDGLGK